MQCTNNTDSLAVLKDILSCVSADGSKSSHVIIEEKQEAKLKKITIAELTPDTLVLATDNGRRNAKMECMSPLFAIDGKYDQNRVCDAVLIRRQGETLQLCYIELKSDSPSGYETQFVSTQCFMRYLEELLKRLFCLSVKITKERFIVFHTDVSNGTRRGIKTKTRFKPQSANTPKSPDKYCLRNGDEVRWTEFF